MESRNAQAIIRLKELQAQVGGMRLALTTSCSNCDVESVVSLLKVISNGIADSIKLLEASQFKEEQLSDSDNQGINNENTIENSEKTEKQNYTDELIDALSNIPSEEEIAQKDIDALMSLAGYMSDDKSIDETIKTTAEKVEDTTLTSNNAIEHIQGLNTLPIHFESPDYNPEELRDGQPN